MPLIEESNISIMETFEPFTQTDIRHSLKRSSNVFCAVDPILTWLEKECLGVMKSLITKIINHYLNLMNH